VRLVDTADLDLVACFGGQQISVTFRSGRLRTWDQAPATEEPPAAPAEWQDFLRRNAALAAKLATHPVR
jgi:hypothetical protein